MGVKALCVLKQGPHLLNTLQAGRMWKALYHRQLEDIIVSPPSSYNAVASGHGPAAAMIAGWIATATLAKSCMRLAMNLFHMSTGGGFLGGGANAYWRPVGAVMAGRVLWSCVLWIDDQHNNIIIIIKVIVIILIILTLCWTRFLSVFTLKLGGSFVHFQCWVCIKLVLPE